MNGREHRLLLATAAMLPGIPGRRSRELAGDGWTALERHLAELPDDRRESAQIVAADLAARDVDVVIASDETYPRRLLDLRTPPQLLFWWGNLALVDERGVGMCGSRDASARGLQYARLFGRAVVDRGMQVVSGYARGVDLETHLGALEAGGATIVVLAEGIGHFRRKRAFAHVAFDAEHVLALSQFPPSQPWSAPAAMTRNATIAALARAMLVIEAREKGGTLNAGLQAIEIGRPVFAIDYAENLPEGNRILFGRGARRLRSQNELLSALDALVTSGELVASGEPEQLALVGRYDYGRRTYVRSTPDVEMTEQRHVVRDGGQWVVKKPGADRASSRHDTQREAERRATEILRNVGGGERVTHDRHGNVRSKDTIPPAKETFPPRDKEH